MRGKRKANKSSHDKRFVQRHRSKRPPVEKRIIPTLSKSVKEQKHAKKFSRKPVTGRRLWLFRVVALTVIPALLFLLLELGLRIAGYGFVPSATIRCKVNGMEAYGDNIKFGWRFFPPTIAREFDPFVFPADKSQDTYRVFVLGASAAKGEPDSAFCFGRFLEVMLRQRYPGINFEVITAATAAINSHVVVEIAGDCARHRADLFIVYLGNNEVIGPYGAGTVFSPISGSLSLIRTGIALKATRLGQLINNLLESIGPEKNIPKTWGGMEMFLEKQVRAGYGTLETVYHHFERNLRDISHTAKKSGAKIIFCTVGSNLKDCPPFASLHRPDLTDTDKKKWDRVYQQGVEYETSENHVQAAEHYLAAAEIDDSYADLQFRLGRCYWAMGEYSKARQRYIRARELDTLRFRADNRINDIVRTIAGDKEAKGVYLVDAAGVFEKNSPNDVPGRELFYEHVHLNPKGTYLLAKTIFEQVEEILPAYIQQRMNSENPLLTETQCARRLAYTDWDQHIITNKILNDFIKKAPFTNQLYHEDMVGLMEQKVKALKAGLTADTLQESAAQYRQAIQSDSENWYFNYKYGKLLAEDLQDYPPAAEQFRIVQKYFPHSYTGYNALASVLRGMGDLDGAMEQCLKAIQINPNCAEAHDHLGWIYRQENKIDKAIEHYSKSLRIVPTNANVHFSLGLVYQNQNRLDEAIEQYRRALQIMPDYPQPYNNLAIALYQKGKLDEAVQTYRRGLLLVPNSFDLHYNLAVLLRKQGHRNEAIKEFRNALRIDPDSAKAQKALKAILESNR